MLNNFDSNDVVGNVVVFEDHNAYKDRSYQYIETYLIRTCFVYQVEFSLELSEFKGKRMREEYLETILRKNFHRGIYALHDIIVFN